ncbi:hypothetical protein GCK72_004168 [Caenorhabditis remanei]|uniref:Uncharacterized protein n=1 Tax=Caenorhabditis remanei TaxID=31234 RepID=A0A6A5HBF8_CAERE|nr:hypothetical protein GCK72_004168 [Caenorhabditis remanei]KAF1764221.1 hypothetical protein GCK72_004168 [Caenorhabditis remanei]
MTGSRITDCSQCTAGVGLSCLQTNRRNDSPSKIELGNRLIVQVSSNLAKRRISVNVKGVLLSKNCSNVICIVTTSSSLGCGCLGGCCTYGPRMLGGRS